MRISMRTGDRGYCNRDFWNVMIRLDGVQQRFVVVADDDTGYVIRAVSDANGKLTINPATEKYEEETLYGKVSIQRYPSEDDAEAMGRACRRT